MDQSYLNLLLAVCLYVVDSFFYCLVQTTRDLISHVPLLPVHFKKACERSQWLFQTFKKAVPDTKCVQDCVELPQKASYPKVNSTECVLPKYHVA